MSSLKTRSLRNLTTTELLPKLNMRMDPKFWSKTSWIQIMYSIWLNLLEVAVGMSFGFPAVQVSQMRNPDSNIPITLDEASWIASIFSLLSPIGSILSGFMLDKYGRRITLISCEVPMCIGWLYIGLAPTPNHIIIGRAISGIGCGMAITPPRIYCSEISLPNLRPMVGSFPNIAFTIGIGSQAALGNFLHWDILCYINSIFVGILMVTYIGLPETPYYILVTKNILAARTTLAKFRSAGYELGGELHQMEEFKRNNHIRRLTFKEKLVALVRKSAVCPFTILMVYFMICHLSGAIILVTWGVDILTSADSSIDPYFGYFLLSISRLVFGVLTAVLVFRTGRKPLALISAGGVAASCFVLAIFRYFQREASLAPQICFMVYTAFATIGAYTLPFLIMSEIYPLQIRGLLCGITVSLCNIFLFICIKSYPYVKYWMGFENMIIFFGATSLMGMVFIYYCLPETKDLTLQEIEEYYNSRRANLTSQRRYESLLKGINSSSHMLIPNDIKNLETIRKRQYSIEKKGLIKDLSPHKKKEKLDKIAKYVLKHEGPTPRNSVSDDEYENALVQQDKISSKKELEIIYDSGEVPKNNKDINTEGENKIEDEANVSKDNENTEPKGHEEAGGSNMKK